MLTIQSIGASLPPAPQALLVTSGNALAGIPASLHGMPLLAVGGRTAARALAAGFTTVHSADGDAGDLAARVPALFDPGAGPLLLASGRGQGRALATALRQAGFRVQRRVVYAAVPVRRFPPSAAAALRDGVHACLFLSAETARVFAHLLPRSLASALSCSDALAIGEDAAHALRGLPFAAVRVSVRPTLDGVLALL